MTRPTPRSRTAGFTLIELLVVISIIAMMIAVLLPALGKARQTARTMNCLSNLRQIGIANTMYQGDFKGFFPYPTTAFAYLDGSAPPDAGKMVWFVALDPYLNTMRPDDESRPGVAGDRSYKSWKQCPDIDKIPASPDNVAGDQNLQEYSRTLKINANLRHLLTTSGSRKWRNAHENDVREPANTVAYGDGNASDLLPWPANTNETGKFGMDVNSTSEAGVGIRHDGGANILFADGHAGTQKLPTYERLAAGGGVMIQAWFPERLPTGDRRAQMPLVWSEPGRFQNNY